MTAIIRVGILEDHQSIIDGYLYRLGKYPEIEVVVTAAFGEELAPLLADNQPIDVLLLDINVPTSQSNPNYYPLLHTIPKVLQTYPGLKVIVISMHSQRSLVKTVMKTGASGYILKDDQETIRALGTVVQLVANGGIHLSQQAYKQLIQKSSAEVSLTARQLEALSLCAAYPDETTAQISAKMAVANSTARNLLSGAYLQLGVRSRAAAIAKAQQMGLIPTPGDIDYPASSAFHR